MGNRLTEARADEIVTALYRRFKDWSKRGFGPDDVTWCEVKADVMQLVEGSATERVRDCIRRCPNDMGFDREMGPIGCRLEPDHGGCVCVAVFAALAQEGGGE